LKDANRVTKERFLIIVGKGNNILLTHIVKHNKINIVSQKATQNLNISPICTFLSVCSGIAAVLFIRSFFYIKRTKLLH